MEKVTKTHPSFLAMIEDSRKQRGPWWKRLIDDVKYKFEKRKNYPSFLSWVEDCWIPFKWRMKYYELSYRTWDDYRVVRIKSLPPGYYGFSQIILYANFQLLCDYVKIDRERLDLLVNDSDPDSKKSSEAAKEILSLYKWWTEVRPNRKHTLHVEECKLRGVKTPPETVEELTRDGMELFRFADYDKEEYKDCLNIMEEIRNRDASYSTEDDDMLIRMMKVRVYIES